MRKKPRRTGEELRAIFEVVNRAEYKKFVKETVSEMLEKYCPNYLKTPVPFYDSFTGLYFMATTEAVANAAKAFKEFKERLELTHEAMKLPWEEETVKKEILSKQEMIQKIIRQKRQFGWNHVVPDTVKGVTFHQGIRPDTVTAR